MRALPEIVDSMRIAINELRESALGIRVTVDLSVGNKILPYLKNLDKFTDLLEKDRIDLEELSGRSLTESMPDMIHEH